MILLNPSMMVHFRKRIESEIIDKINQQIVLKELKKKKKVKKVREKKK